MVDTSFVLALALQDPRSDRVRGRWKEWNLTDERILAPSLLAYEVAGSLRNKVDRQLMQPAAGAAALDLLLALPIELVRPEGLHRAAYQAAEELSLPTAYDGHFLVLAELLGAELWTLDEKFQNKALARYDRVLTV